MLLNSMVDGKRNMAFGQRQGNPLISPYVSDRRRRDQINTSKIKIDEPTTSSIASNDESSNNMGVITMTHLTQGDHLSHLSHCSQSKTVHEIHQ